MNDINYGVLTQFKYNLILEDKDNLLKYYDDDERFNTLLLYSSFLMQEDPHFFLLDDNLEKMITLVSYLRNDHKNNRFLANYLVSELDKLKRNPEKKELIENYFTEENRLRGSFFTHKGEVIASILNDYVFISSIGEGYFEHDVVNFLATTNYFINKYPDIYEDKNIKSLTNKMLDAIKGMNKVSFKFKSKKLIKKINKINIE